MLGILSQWNNWEDPGLLEGCCRLELGPEEGAGSRNPGETGIGTRRWVRGCCKAVSGFQPGKEQHRQVWQWRWEVVVMDFSSPCQPVG